MMSQSVSTPVSSITFFKAKLESTVCAPSDGEKSVRPERIQPPQKKRALVGSMVRISQDGLMRDFSSPYHGGVVINPPFKDVPL